MKLVSICREYVTAIRIKAAVAETGNDIVSLTKLEKISASFGTKCNIKPQELTGCRYGV